MTDSGLIVQVIDDVSDGPPRTSFPQLASLLLFGSDFVIVVLGFDGVVEFSDLKVGYLCCVVNLGLIKYILKI